MGISQEEAEYKVLNVKVGAWNSLTCNLKDRLKLFGPVKRVGGYVPFRGSGVSLRKYILINSYRPKEVETDG